MMRASSARRLQRGNSRHRALVAAIIGSLFVIGPLFVGRQSVVQAALPQGEQDSPAYVPGQFGTNVEPGSAPRTAVQPAAAQPADGPRQATYQSPVDYRGNSPTGPSVNRLPSASSAQYPAPSADSATAPAARPGGALSAPAEPMPISAAGHDGGDSAAHGHRAPSTPSAFPAMMSMFASLAIVLGLFFGVMWFLRRGLPKGTRTLSSDVVEVLGRAPLSGRQQMHVIRFGSRLLLISVSPNGAETLAEITEPSEVDRLAGICQQTNTNSATTAFRHIFRQLSEARGVKTRVSREPADELADDISDDADTPAITTTRAAQARRLPLPSRREEDGHA